MILIWRNLHTFALDCIEHCSSHLLSVFHFGEVEDLNEWFLFSFYNFTQEMLLFSHGREHMGYDAVMYHFIKYAYMIIKHCKCSWDTCNDRRRKLGGGGEIQKKNGNHLCVLIFSWWSFFYWSINANLHSGFCPGGVINNSLCFCS